MGADEWPRPSHVIASRGAAKSWQRSSAPAARTDLHFTKEMFAQYKMAISHFNVTCKFSDHPKYEVYLQRPNNFKLDEVYSVPCGECCDTWIFINLKVAPEYGPDKKNFVSQYLEKLGWTEITNRNNKRFICRECKGPAMGVQ